MQKQENVTKSPQLHYFFNNAIYLAKAHLYHFHNNGNKEKKTH